MQKFGLGSSFQDICLDDLERNGFESKVLDCSSRAIWSHNFDHSKDVGVMCSPGKTIRKNYNMNLL